VISIGAPNRYFDGSVVVKDKDNPYDLSGAGIGDSY